MSTPFTLGRDEARADRVIVDPGDAGAIPLLKSGGVCRIVSAGAETRTIAAPPSEGFVLTVAMDTDGGAVTITTAAEINAAGGTTITLDDVGDFITLIGVSKSGSLVWRTVAASAAALDAALEGVTLGTWAASKAMTLDASGDATAVDGGDIAFGTTTGTKLGTAVTQKIGFWNATPIVQPAAAGQAAVAAPTAYSAHGSGATPVTSNAATDLDTTAAALATLVTETTSLRTLVDAMRTALVNAGIMKGAA